MTTAKPKWTEIKKQLTGLEQKELISLIGTLDLMLTYVETGTKFTNTYGDLWESFYNSMESVLDEIAQLLFQHGEQLYNELNTAQRLWKLQSNVSHIGWGYGDYVTDRIDEIRDHFGDI